MFVSLEGLDGSGKTSVLGALCNSYVDVCPTSEPTNFWTGEEVKRCAENNDNPLTEMFFFLGDRVNHIEKIIKPMDKSGATVISDRYADSTRAYQPYLLSQTEYFDSEAHAKLYIDRILDDWLIEPDLTIYIDVSVETALNRCNDGDKFERREHLESASRNYEEIASDFDRVQTIDGEQSLNSVIKEAKTLVEEERRKV